MFPNTVIASSIDICEAQDVCALFYNSMEYIVTQNISALTFATPISSLMCKSEVKSLHPLVLRTNHIVFLLLLRQSVPLPIAHLVTPDIESLDEIEKHNVETANP